MRRFQQKRFQVHHGLHEQESHNLPPVILRYRAKCRLRGRRNIPLFLQCWT